MVKEHRHFGPVEYDETRVTAGGNLVCDGECSRGPVVLLMDKKYWGKAEPAAPLSLEEKQKAMRARNGKKEPVVVTKLDEKTAELLSAQDEVEGA